MDFDVSHLLLYEWPHLHLANIDPLWYSKAALLLLIVKTKFRIDISIMDCVYGGKIIENKA